MALVSCTPPPPRFGTLARDLTLAGLGLIIVVDGGHGAGLEHSPGSATVGINSMKPPASRFSSGALARLMSARAWARLVGAGVALSLVCAAAPAAPAAVHRHRCPRGTLTVVRPHGCISQRLVLGAIAPRRDLAVHARDLTSDLLYPREHARFPARSRALNRAIVSDFGATFPQLLRADANGPPYRSGRLGASAAVAHSAGASITQTVSGPGGFTATGTGQLINAPTGRVGDVFSVSVDGKISRAGASGTLSQSVAVGAYADACPNSNGEVDGTGVADSAMGLAATGRQQSVAGRTSIDATYTLHGRVGDDGKLIDYSLVYDGNYSYDGFARGLFGVGHSDDAHLRAHMHMAFDHLRVGVPISDADLAGQLGNYQTSGFGLAERLSGAYKDALVSTALMVYFAKSDADRALTKAQQNWLDNAACLKATFDPNSIQDAQPGSTHDVAVSVQGVRAGQPVSMPVTLSATRGAVTPTQAESGSSPIQANSPCQTNQATRPTCMSRARPNRVASVAI